MPKTIVYRTPSDIEKFDIDRYVDNLNKYGEVSKEEAEEALSVYNPSDLLHVSCLVTVGTKLIENDEKARQYYEDHNEWFSTTPNFERLRRITGYLVGSLERWNDGKRAEERERVKHSTGFDNANGQFSLEQKDEKEAIKLENSIASQI